MATTVFYTSGVTLTVPADYNSAANTWDAIGGGQGGGDASTVCCIGFSGTGGKGGGWCQIVNQTLTASSTPTCQIGAGGGHANPAGSGTDTLLKDNSSVTVLLAAGGNSGTTQVGTTKKTGGNGGAGAFPGGGGGGGGAAGSTANGANGVGGGADNGGAGGRGDPNAGGVGGAGGIFLGAAAVAGSPGTEYEGVKGSGGGGGGGDVNNNSGANGGLYGGGAGAGGGSVGAGGNGRNGLLILVYTPASTLTYIPPQLNELPSAYNTQTLVAY